jgi:hypothetical protein
MFGMSLGYCHATRTLRVSMLRPGEVFRNTRGMPCRVVCAVTETHAEVWEGTGNHMTRAYYHRTAEVYGESPEQVTRMLRRKRSLFALFTN